MAATRVCEPGQVESTSETQTRSGCACTSFRRCGAAGLTGEEAAVPETTPPLGLRVGGQQALPRVPCEDCGLSLYKCLRVSVSGGDRGARVLHPTTGNHMPLKTVVDERKRESTTGMAFASFNF